jgi:hypothetical protein
LIRQEIGTVLQFVDNKIPHKIPCKMCTAQYGNQPIKKKIYRERTLGLASTNLEHFLVR